MQAQMSVSSFMYSNYHANSCISTATDEAHSAEEYCHINREEAYPVQHDVMKISK